MIEFQRARSDEQREMRRQAILDTAAGMLAEMPVVDVGLNELARRVGLAKSNVLRYFESREAVLLELLELRYRAWIAELTPLLADHRGDLRARRDRLIAAFVSSLEREPVLCDLFNAQAAILERNISAEVAARYKRGSLAATAELVSPVEALVPEFGPGGAMKFCAAGLLSAGALWSHSHPAPAMLAAYEQHPELAAVRLEFVPVLTDLLTVLARGILAPD
ncbi:TetR/AcrR family transcriptional regulator [Nocardia yamanashiensis]|uniref:TetR/AcrR family transcriptional regulator n=1 Tax=Nocardia yamanashiensis TaxID=209247 RepID=UPI001E62D519|nr:TetR/AcrR family transcriptional regulator [Nocardia yamanashiensis]UGT41943.1 TetR/AcrR family transcriptional regulator [Nocardia yamanashiensis]